MDSVKTTYWQMVEKLSQTKTHSEYRKVEKDFLSKEYIQLNEQNQVYTDAVPEADEEFAPTYRFNISTLPTHEMLEGATEEVVGDSAVLKIPNYIQERIYFVNEDGKWKLDAKNLSENMGI